MQECACCTMTSLCRDMACLSRALWQSHTCSTYAKGLTKPEIHQSAFRAHRRTHRDLRRMHVHAEMRTHERCADVALSPSAAGWLPERDYIK